MITPTKNKIMLCGMHERTLGKQDWDDTSYERWGLAHHRVRYHYYDRLFESHSPEIIMKHTPYHMDRIADYTKRGFPVYSPWEFPEGVGVTTITHDEVFDSIYHPSPRRFWGLVSEPAVSQCDDGVLGQIGDFGKIRDISSCSLDRLGIGRYYCP